jgi:hypothetical protein
MTLTRAQRLGLAITATIYLAMCVAVLNGGRHPLRPLYEGIGPAPPYRWVNPPAQFKATNIAPIAVSQTIQLTGSGSNQTGVATTDGQLVLSLPAGAIPPSLNDTTASVSITPHDPAKLGPLPAGLYSDGNSYEVRVSYQPTGTHLTVAARPVDVVIVTPVPSVALLSSADGQTWHRVTDHHIPGQAAVAATITAFGYLLAAANAPVVVKPASGMWRILLIVGLGLLVGVPLVAALLLRNRGRRKGP